MWKRGRTWVTLALLVLLNIVAWDIRTVPQEHAGSITLYQHQVKDGLEYTALKPARFYFKSIWYSYAVALFVGFVLPFILAPLLSWLWQRKHDLVRGARRLLDTRQKRTVAFWLALLAAFNVLAWDVANSPYETDFGLPMYRVVPGIRIYGPATSYMLSLLVGVGLPLALFGTWLRKQRNPGMGWVEAAGIRKLPAVRSVLALLPLLLVFNLLAWDWVESRAQGDVGIVLGQVERAEDGGWSYRQVTHYYGITPGILVHSEGASFALSFFVGEVLPFMLAPALFRRRRPQVLPLPPVAGAAR